MANKYKGKQSGSTTVTDLTNVLASKVYTEASWCTSYFKGESFNQAGTDTVNTSFPDFKVNGTAVSGIKKGYFPTKENCFLSITTPGHHTIVRSEFDLTVTYASGSSTKIKASSFRDGVVPHVILGVCVGGGGGGGGGAWEEYEKDKWRHYCGGAGGGGGVSVCRFSLDDNRTYTIHVGAGGSYGTEGASEADGGSNGTSGTSGGSSTIVNPDNYMVCGGYGGSGGKHAIGKKDEAIGNGAGGNGGSCASNTSVTKIANMAGGKGNSYSSHSSTGTNGLSFTPTSGTGASSWTVTSSKNNNGTMENANDVTNNVLSFFSGGCSYNHGSYYSMTLDEAANSATLDWTYKTDGGGGGVAGILMSNGANGAIYLYY